MGNTEMTDTSEEASKDAKWGTCICEEEVTDRCFN